MRRTGTTSRLAVDLTQALHRAAKRCPDADAQPGNSCHTVSQNPDLPIPYDILAIGNQQFFDDREGRYDDQP